MQNSGFRYTAQQLEIIAEALQPLSPEVRGIEEYLTDALSHACTQFPDPCLPNRAASDSVRSQLEEYKAAKELLSYSKADLFLSDEDYLALKSARAEAQILLERIEVLLIKGLDNIENHPDKKPKGFFASRTNRFVFLLSISTAELWEARGGVVNHGKHYRDFFTAVMKPVLTDEKVREKHHTSWTNSTFKTHVEARMRASGTAGKRGKKRMNSV